MLVELIEIKETARDSYSLKTIYINPDQVVYLSENGSMKQKLQEGKLNLGLNQNFTNFTNIRMNYQSYAANLIVIGDPGMVEQKINNSKRKQLLKENFFCALSGRRPRIITRKEKSVWTPNSSNRNPQRR